MTILFRKYQRLSNLMDKKSAKKVYPVILYAYGKGCDTDRSCQNNQ